MKKIIFLLLATTLSAVPATAGVSCGSDPIVGRWILERDTAAMKMVKTYITGGPKKALAPLLGLIVAKELNINTECYKEPEFVDTNLVLNKATFQVTVDTAPALFLDRATGGLLSPEREYNEPKQHKGGF